MFELEGDCHRYVDFCNQFISNNEYHAEELIQLSKYLSKECINALVATEITKYNIIEVSIKCVHVYMHTRIVLDEDSTTTPLNNFEPYLIHMSYLFSNYTSCGIIYIEHFWSNYYHEIEFLLVTMVSVHHPKSIAAIIALLCNCIRIQHDEEVVCYRTKDLLKNRALCCQVLLVSLPTINHSTQPPSPIQQRCMLDLLMLVGESHTLSGQLSGNSGQLSQFPTHEQLIFLNHVHNVLDDAAMTSCIHQLYNDTILQVVPFTNQITTLLLSITTSSSTDILAADFSASVVSVCSKVLGSILSLFSSANELRTSLMDIQVSSTTIIQVCCEMLKLFKSKTNTGVQWLDLLLLIDRESRNEVVRDILCLLCNLIYRCKPAQDTFLDTGALAMVLSYCATDFDNPLSREWALLTIRNACEENARVQEFVSSLQPQQVLQDELMREHGVSVEMDPASGKFKFKQDDQPQVK